MSNSQDEMDLFYDFMKEISTLSYNFFCFIHFREESEPFELGIFLCPLIPAVQLFICSIDHFGFLAQFVGICLIAPPIFHSQHFPSITAGPVWKGQAPLPTICALPKIFGFSASDWGHRLRFASPASSLVEPNPLLALIGRIRLRRVERRRSRRCLARAGKLLLSVESLSLLTFTQATGPSVDIRRRLLRLLHKYLIGRGPNI